MWAPRSLSTSLPKPSNCYRLETSFSKTAQPCKRSIQNWLTCGPLQLTKTARSPCTLLTRCLVNFKLVLTAQTPTAGRGLTQQPVMHCATAAGLSIRQRALCRRSTPASSAWVLSPRPPRCSPTTTLTQQTLRQTSRSPTSSTRVSRFSAMPATATLISAPTPKPTCASTASCFPALCWQTPA